MEADKKSPTDELADEDKSETPHIIELVPADKNPDGESVKRFVHRRNGVWDIRATRYPEEGEHILEYHAQCSACDDSFTTFGQAEAHIDNEH